MAEVAEEEAHYTLDAEPGVAGAHGVLARGRNDARAENVRAAKPSPERAWSKRRTASASGSGKARGRRRQQQLPITVVGTGVGVARANSSRSQRRSPVAHETSAGPKCCDQCAREVDRTTSYRRAGKPWRLAGLNGKGSEGAARGGGRGRKRDLADPSSGLGRTGRSVLDLCGMCHELIELSEGALQPLRIMVSLSAFFFRSPR